MALATLLYPSIQQTQPAATTAADVGSAFGAIGGIISALGAMQAARAQNQQRKFQADMGEINAKSQKQTLTYQSNVASLNAEHAKFVGDTNARIAELGAQSVLYQGERQVGALTMRAGNLKSAQRATMAANGIDLGSGNAAEVQASTEIMKEVDKTALEANAVRSAWGYRMQGTEAQNNANQQALNYETSAEFGSVAARNTNAPQRGVDTSVFGAGASSLMSSAGTVAKSWYQSSRMN
jgi:hypothetical protein